MLILRWRLVFFITLFLSIVWPQAPINLEAGGMAAGPQQAAITAGQALQPMAAQKIQAFEKPGIILPVTDPAKQVEEPHTRKIIKEQGIDPGYVELIQDYARHLTPAEKAAKDANPQTKYLPDPSPYARTYKDRQTGKFIMETQGLPMVTADGRRIEPGWEKISAAKFRSKINLFLAEVNGNKVALTVLNDQPDSRKKNDKLIFQAQLFLNGAEQISTGPILLDSDPINPSYHQNTLEWDYGIAKRRIRLIEGHFLGSWVFPANPHGEIRIKYNQSGDYRLKLGQYAIGTDEEVVSAEVFNRAAYPFKVSDSSTFYPDADPETTSVDGRVIQSGGPSGLSWSAIRNAAGSSAVDYDETGQAPFTSYSAYSTTDTWSTMNRGIFLFDTSALQDTATITAATLSLYGFSKGDGPSPAQNPDINIYSSAPASNTALAAGDFDSLGALAFATAIPYANWGSGNRDFTLNSNGRAAISKTGVSKFGTRNANYDVSGTSPAWASGRAGNHTGYYSEEGTGYKPKLVVTYTVPPFRFEGLKMEGIKVN